jgi:hypothetical protein
MNPSILIIVSWLQASAAPVVSTHQLPNLLACRAALEAAVDMSRAQAASNMSSASGGLVRLAIDGQDEVALRTRTSGRELMRMRCIATNAGARTDRPHPSPQR